MTPQKTVETLLSKQNFKHTKVLGNGFAPVNIALIKYWGKRNHALNCPVTDSLSISLPNVGTHTQISVIDLKADHVILNGKSISSDHAFYKRLEKYLDLFRTQSKYYFKIETKSDVPISAGLASSASGFAALVNALCDLFDWDLSDTMRSILARLGSGSASRSFWNGFVLWNKGEAPDGLDSFAQPIDITWPGLCVGLLIKESGEKPIGSRAAMNQTTETSPLYAAWPLTVETHMGDLLEAIQTKNFELLGKTLEHNAQCMHATMTGSWPSIDYSTAQTRQAKDTVWALREKGVAVYFTQDAGPNLKLVFEKKDRETVERAFEGIKVVEVFN